MTQNRRLLPSIALLLTAAAWGSTVVVAKGAYESMTPAHLLISRLTLTGLCLLPAFLPHLRMKRETCLRGIVLGLIFNSGLALQMLGLDYTPPSLSAFITASYVVFTAILTPVLLKQPTPGRTWFAVLLALAGIGVLAFGHGGGDGGFGFGAAITLLSALLFALHILLLGRWVEPETVQSLTLMQALTGAVGGAVFPALRRLPPALHLGVVVAGPLPGNILRGRHAFPAELGSELRAGRHIRGNHVLGTDVGSCVRHRGRDGGTHLAGPGGRRPGGLRAAADGLAETPCPLPGRAHRGAAFPHQTPRLRALAPPGAGQRTRDAKRVRDRAPGSPAPGWCACRCPDGAGWRR